MSKNKWCIFLFSYDGLWLNDGYNDWEPLWGVYSAGQEIDFDFSPTRTPGNVLQVMFLSDNSVNKGGFLAEYEIGR